MFKSLSASKEIYTAFQDRYNDYHFVQDTHGIVLEITIDNGREEITYSISDDEELQQGADHFCKRGDAQCQ